MTDSTRMIEVAGAQLHSETTGQGFPLIAMHGTSFDSNMLRRWLDPLADIAQLTYFDARGCGRSSRPSDPTELNHAAWVSDIDAVRQQLGLGERVFLLGHSHSGILAIEYALAYPESVAGLILCATFAAFDFGETLMAMAARRLSPELQTFLGDVFSGPIASDEAFAQTFPKILPAYFHQWSEQLGSALMEGVTMSADALNRSTFGELVGYSAVPRLGEITAPTLVIGGDDDPFGPVEQALQVLHHGIPNSELVVLEQCGHFPFVEKSEQFHEAVRAWLAQQAG